MRARTAVGTRTILALAIALTATAVAPARAAEPQRYVAGFPPVSTLDPNDTPAPQRDPSFILSRLSLTPTATGYTATVALDRKRAGQIQVTVILEPPLGDSRAATSATARTQADAVSLKIVNVTPAWGIYARAFDAGTTLAETPIVPVGSLTNEATSEEMRAWYTGARHIGEAHDRRSRCAPPPNVALDGFKAAVVEEKAVFTLHFGDAPAGIDSFEGAHVTGQVGVIDIQPDPANPSSIVGVEFDVARKTAAYVDARTPVRKLLGPVKIDVLGQNVLLKTSWRFGDPSTPFDNDGLLGNISPSSLVRARSELRTSKGRCAIETAWAPIEELAPRVNDGPITPAEPPGGAARPYLGLLLAFGGIIVIVGIAALSRWRAQRAGSGNAAGTG